MARNVTISTIGPRPMVLSEPTALETIVERMIERWRDRFSKVLPDKPDLIVVPEACDRPVGVTDTIFPLEKRIEYYAIRKDRILRYFSEVAAQHKCYMVYSAARQIPDGTWRNSSILIDREGKQVGIYNKNHLVIDEYEKAGALYGKEAVVLDCDFGRVGFAICFDLNFEELRLQYVNLRPDVIVFSSMYHGGLMQAYWAHSCRSFFVGAIAGLPCQIRDPLGEVVASSSNYFDFVTTTVNLDSRVVHLDGNWKKLDKMKAKYGKGVSVKDPGMLGSVLLTNNLEGVCIDDIIDTFDIEKIDAYFLRCRAHRQQAGHIEKEQGSGAIRALMENSHRVK